MGYATVLHAPRIHTYQEARKQHDNTPPIRGRKDLIKPLAERRYADTYSIRLNAEEDVQCVLYSTPVVTFKQDGDVEIHMGGWGTVSTRQFITSVLGIGTYGEKGHSMLSFVSGRVALPDNDKLTIRKDAQNAWVPVNARALTGYKMNRAKANSVRAQYKEAYDYFKSMIKLRRASADVTRIVLTHSEYAPFSMRVHDNHSRKAWELVQEGGIEKYYEAFLRLSLIAEPSWYGLRVLSDDTGTIRVSITNLLRALDEQVLREHAQEVLDRVDLPQGKTPNPKYKDWIEG